MQSIPTEDEIKLMSPREIQFLFYEFFTDGKVAGINEVFKDYICIEGK
jgi:hypothetical protein